MRVSGVGAAGRREGPGRRGGARPGAGKPGALAWGPMDSLFSTLLCSSVSQAQVRLAAFVPGTGQWAWCGHGPLSTDNLVFVGREPRSPRPLAPSEEGPCEVWRTWGLAASSSASCLGSGPPLARSSRRGSPGRGAAPSAPPPPVQLSCYLRSHPRLAREGWPPCPVGRAASVCPGRPPLRHLLLLPGQCEGGGRALTRRCLCSSEGRCWDSHPRAGFVSESQLPSSPRLEPLHSPLNEGGPGPLGGGPCHTAKVLYC